MGKSDSLTKKYHKENDRKKMADSKRKEERWKLKEEMNECFIGNQIKEMNNSMRKKRKRRERKKV